ncbi:MAG: accessory factor UbiK family protein [Pseudomonadota bacterium]
MTQTTGRFFDDIAKLMSTAAGAANGARVEVETMVRGQAERILNEMDVVRREEFEAVKAMAQKAREENDTLRAKLADLEARVSKT